MSSDVTAIDETNLPLLAQHGLIGERHYLPALELFRDTPYWNGWAMKALFALSIGHILAGIIFFFAHNWFGLPDLAKFGVVGGGIALAILGWMALRLDGIMAQALGIAATVLVGVMFAVFGQVYQTPALIHTPFILWAFMTLPFAAMSRNLAHWAVWLVIAVVAVFAYASTGLRIIGNEFGKDLFIIGAGAITLLALAAYDRWLAGRRSWTQGDWFRVLVIAIIGVFLVVGFTSSFWNFKGGMRPLVSFLALSLSVVLMGYLYRFKPTLAGLAVAAFTLFLIAMQFLFRIFEGLNDVSSLMFVFIGLVAMIIGMAKAFSHFSKISENKTGKSLAASKSEAPPKNVPSVTDVAKVLAQDETAIQSVLSANANDHSPWYIETFLAIGGIIAALFGCAFVGSLLGLLLNAFDGFGLVLFLIGLALYGGAMIFRIKTGNGFTRHFSNTLILVGSITAVIGLAILIKNIDVPLILAIALSAGALVFVRDRIIEYLAALTFIGCIAVEVYYRMGIILPETILLILSTALGVFFLTRPLGNRLYDAAGTAFLIAPALLGIGLAHFESITLFSKGSVLDLPNWLPRAASLLVLVAAVAWLNRANQESQGWRPPLFILIPLVIAMALLPYGGASALLLILAGYILGSRTLAIVGVFFQIYFLYMFYYDLTLSLGAKSYLLLATGLVFLGAWFAADRFMKRETLS